MKKIAPPPFGPPSNTTSPKHIPMRNECTGREYTGRQIGSQWLAMLIAVQQQPHIVDLFNFCAIAFDLLILQKKQLPTPALRVDQSYYNSSWGGHECVDRVLWQSVQYLLIHFLQNPKTQPHGGASWNVRPLSKPVCFILDECLYKIFVQSLQ